MDELRALGKAFTASTRKARQKLHLKAHRGPSKQQSSENVALDDIVSEDKENAEHQDTPGAHDGRKHEGGRTDMLNPPVGSTNDHPVVSPLYKKDVVAALPVYFPEESVVVLCKEDGEICMSQNYVEHSEGHEMEAIIETVGLEDRNDAIRQGLMFMGQRFEIFQFHPPLVYGRTAGLPPKESLGIVVVRHDVHSTRECMILDENSQHDRGEAGQSHTCYLVVTYALPETSAHILCQARLFCSKFL